LERLWIAPAVICALAGAAIAFSPHEGRFTLVNVILFAAALGVGGLIGWLRAKGVKLTVEPMTHQVTSAVSPLGLVLLVAVFVVRYALRFATQSGLPGVKATTITNAMLFLAIGVVISQRIEIGVRARRLIKLSRDSLAAQSVLS
jgi:uncharacterized membrane protein